MLPMCVSAPLSRELLIIVGETSHLLFAMLVSIVLHRFPFRRVDLELMPREGALA